MYEKYYDEIMLAWSKQRKKSEIEKVIDMEKTFTEKKRNLGGRVQVLRVVVRQFYKKYRPNMQEWNFSKQCERVLDNMLAKYDFDVEQVIDQFRLRISDEDKGSV